MRNMRIEQSEQRVFSSNEKIILFLLLLSFMDFYSYGIHLMVVAFLAFLLLMRRVYLVNGVVPAALLTVSMILFGELSVTSLSSMVNTFVWPLAFSVGFGLLYRPAYPKDVAKAEQKANIYFLITATGFFIHLMLNLLVNTDSSELGRNTADVWSNEVFAATGQAGLACVPMAWCIATLFKKKKAAVKIWTTVAILAMLYYNLTLGSRTMVYSLLIVAAVAVLFLLKQDKSNKNKQAVFSTIIVIGIVAVLAYSSNLWGVRSLIEESTLMDRLLGEHATQLSEDSRWSNKLQYLKHMPKYLGGGNHILRLVGSYAHDILLDTYDDVGLLALVAVIALLWDGISKLRGLLRSNIFSNDTKVTVLCIYISIFITFAVEPILAGLPWLLMAFCFFHGIVTNLASSARHLEAGKD